MASRRKPPKAPAKSPKKKAVRTQSSSFVSKLGAVSQNYALAAVAGAGVILVGAASILWAGGYVGMLGESVNRAVTERTIAAGLVIHRVTVRGRSQTAADELQSAIGPVIGDSILGFDVDAARRRVEELGWVRAAAVTRLLPDTLHISIRERAPSAVWQMEGRLQLIDESGALIREIGTYEYSYLPLIVGAGAPEAASGLLIALGAHPDLKESASALVRVAERRWNMRMRNGIDVKLPETGFAEALGTLAALQDAHGLLDEPLEYIDLRDPERMVVRRRGEAETDAAQ